MSFAVKACSQHEVSCSREGKKKRVWTPQPSSLLHHDTFTWWIYIYLQLQRENLVFQVPHFSFFSVSGCLGCNSVLQFPEEDRHVKHFFFRNRWQDKLNRNGLLVIAQSAAIFLPRRQNRSSTALLQIWKPDQLTDCRLLKAVDKAIPVDRVVFGLRIYLIFYM